MSNEVEATSITTTTSSDVWTVGHLLTHLRNPQNLLTYMVFTAWMKFMGLASHIPSITFGG